MKHSFDVLRWAIQTFRQDRNAYQKKNKPFSPRRMWGTLSPNLNRPIFLIGAPRSGTTFLGHCIGQLPEVSYHNEPVAITGLGQLVYDEVWSFGKARQIYRQTYRWLMRIHLDGHLRFAEKTPLNCFLVPFFHRTFPDAQFIHIIRDGRDAALSYSKKPWLQAAMAGSGERHVVGFLYGPYARFWIEPERRKEFETTSDIHRCIWAWRRHVSSALAASEMLTDSHYLELRYEELATDPHREAQRLLDYLGISEPASRRQFGEAVSRANSLSVGLWKQQLSPVQLEQIKQEAGPLLQQLGYL